MGRKLDTYQEQIKEFAKAMFNGTIVCVLWKGPINKSTSSVLKAFKSTIASKSSHIQFSLIVYIYIIFLVSVLWKIIVY